MTSIHPSAIIDPSATLGEGTQVGPRAIIGPRVVVGDGCRIDAAAVLERDVRLGDGCRVGTGSVLGGDPQDRSDTGDGTSVEVGPGTIVREYVTINRGTVATGRTVIGASCYLMAYVHVAHDCRLGDRVVIANAVQMAGHVDIGDDVNIGGLTPIHQFVRVGTLAFIGGGSRVNQDIPPYTMAVGNPLRLFGLNTVGLKRAGVSDETRFLLKSAYRRVFNGNKGLKEGIARVRAEVEPVEEVARFLEFIEQSARGVEV